MHWLARILLTWLFIFPALLKAQVPDEPIMVGLKFSVVGGPRVGYQSGPSPIVRATLAGLVTETPSSGDQYLAPVKMAMLEPGKSYNCTFISPIANNAYRVLNGVYFSPPPGYSVWINGKQQMAWSVYREVKITESITVKVLADASELGAPVGASTSLVGGRMLWQISMGQKLSGESAGNLLISSPAVTTDNWNGIFDPRGLVYDVDTVESVAQNKITVFYDSAVTPKAIRQIFAPQSTVDVVPTYNTAGTPSSGVAYYDIRFFHPSQRVQTVTTSLNTFSGEPFIEYRIKSEGTVTAPKVEITKKVRSSSETAVGGLVRTEETSLLRTTDGNGRLCWRVDDWWTADATSTAGRSVVKHDWETVGSETLEVVKILGESAGGDVVASREKRKYTPYSWGDYVTRVESGDGVDTAISKSETFYYDNSADVGSWGYPYARKQTGGAWEYYDYVNSTNVLSIGRLIAVFKPFLDDSDPLTTVVSAPAAPAWTTGLITSITYGNDEYGMKTRPTLVEIKSNNVLASKQTHSYYTDTANSSVLVETTSRSYPSPLAAPAVYVESRRRDYLNSYDNGLHTGRPFSETAPDGTRVSHIRQYVSWDTALEKYVNNSAGLCVRSGRITGTSTAVAANGSDPASVLQTTYDGFNHEDIHLHAGRSTLDLAYTNQYGDMIRTESYVWESTGATTGAWSLLVSENYTYNLSHRLVSRQNSKGELITSSYLGERLDEAVDASGAKIKYVYDDANRVVSETKEGVGSLPTLTTSYTYDAAGRVLSQKLSGAGEAKVVITSTTYDMAGRVLSQVSPEGYVTKYAYDPAARSTTVSTPASFPVGTTPITYVSKTESRYVDGRVKSITGSAVVPEFYTYACDSATGWLTSTVSSSTTGSSRYIKTEADALGRVVKTARPRPPKSDGTGSQSGEHVEFNEYNSLGQLIKTKRGGPVGESALPEGTPTLADTLYVYDSRGRMYRSGLDVNGDGDLDLAGPDRVSETEERFEVLSENVVENNKTVSKPFWWLRKEAFAYDAEAAATRISGGYGRTRLSGFTGNLRSETQSWDAESNKSWSTTEVDRAAQTVTTRTRAAGLANDQVDVMVNGFATTTTTPDGLVFTTEYDKLGRAFKSTDPRTGTTTTYYKDGPTIAGPPALTTTTTQIDYVKDSRNKTVASYTYDTAGRVSVATNADGKKTNTVYTDLGQPAKIWGSATMPVEYGYNGYGERTTLKLFQGGSGWDGDAWPTDTGTASVTTWEFDPASGVLKTKKDALTVAEPARRSVTYVYDALGRVRERKWARERSGSPGTLLTATHVYAAGTGDLLIKDYNDATPDLTYTYTRNGKVKTITDGTGTRSYEYDAAKPWRLDREILPDGFAFKQLYEESATTPLAGAVVLPGRGRGFQFGTLAAPASVLEQTSGTSNLGRLVALSSTRAATGGFGVATQAFAYTYTANSRLLSGYTATGTGFAVTRGYEAQRNVLTSLESKWGASTLARYGYITDDVGRRRHSFQSGSAFDDYGLGVDKGLRQDYTYDDRGQLTHAKASFDYAPASLGAEAGGGAQAVPNRRYAYAYDGAGNRTGNIFNQLGTTAPAVTATYNLANELTTQSPQAVSVHGLADSGTTVAVEDIEDLDGDGVVAPKASQATKVVGSNYWHKQLEFIPTVEEWRKYGRTFFVGAYKAGEANQVSRFAFFSGRGETMNYDLDGNLTQDDRWEYKWDAENRLIQQKSRQWLADAGAGAQLDIYYAYDYMGRRVSKRVVTLDAVPMAVSQKETRYYYAGWNLIAEAEVNPDGSTGAFLRSYTWGLDLVGSLSASGGVGALLQIADHGDGSRYFPAYDGNGNIAALVNASSGVVAASYEYSPYGESLRTPTAGIGLANPFRFSTKFTDNETGLVYYGYRYYDPAKGRFINRDPIEERGGLNLYGFCGNDGVNGHEVLGMFFKKWWKKVKKWVKKNWTSIVGAALTLVNPALGMLWSAGVGYHYGGVKGMAVGFASSYIGGQVAGSFGLGSKLATNMLSGGIAGGVSAGVSGGNIGEGFLSGATTAGVLTVASPVLQHAGQGISAGAMQVGRAIRSIYSNVRDVALHIIYPNVPEGYVTMGPLMFPDLDGVVEPAPVQGGGFEATPDQLAQAMEAMQRAPRVQQPWGGQGPSASRAISANMRDSGRGASLKYGANTAFPALTVGGLTLGAGMLAAPVAGLAAAEIQAGLTSGYVAATGMSANLSYAATGAGSVYTIGGRFDFGQAVQATGMLANRLAAPIAGMVNRTQPYIPWVMNAADGANQYWDLLPDGSPPVTVGGTAVIAYKLYDENFGGK